MKGNGRIIAFAAIVVFIVVFVLLNMTVFTISKVTVQNAVYSDYIDKAGIVQSSEINYNQNIFLLNEANVRLHVEEAYPYLSVSSVERKFPSTVVIHVDMRTPVMSISKTYTDQYAILDTELKILDVVGQDSELYRMATHINNVSIDDPVVGVKIDDEEYYVQCLRQIGYVSDNESLQFWHFFTSITIENYIAYITLRTGVVVRLDDIGAGDVHEKLRYALELYKTFDEQDYQRRSGYIYFNSEHGWMWSEHDNAGTDALRLQNAD